MTLHPLIICSFFYILIYYKYKKKYKKYIIQNNYHFFVRIFLLFYFIDKNYLSFLYSLFNGDELFLTRLGLLVDFFNNISPLFSFYFLLSFFYLSILYESNPYIFYFFLKSFILNS